MIVKPYRITNRAPWCALKEWGADGCCPPGRSLADELDFAYVIEFCSTGKGFTQGQGC